MARYSEEKVTFQTYRKEEEEGIETRDNSREGLSRREATNLL
jgi:hypothetical protein